MARSKSDVRERFFSHVRKAPGTDACWEWTGAVNDEGYGVFWINDAIGVQLAHRWAYMMEHRVVLEEDVILDHLCRNHPCIRPSHMDPVTHEMNVERGESVTAQNKRKDACRNGHPFTPDNTYVTAAGGRQCRTCMREANRRYSEGHPDRARERVRRLRERRAG